MKLLAPFAVVWRAGLRPARWLFAAAVGVVAALSVPLVAAGTPSAAHTSHLTVSQSEAAVTLVGSTTLSTTAVAPAAPPLPAQPTVSEGATNAQGERLLAGADRYATAVLLAEVPLDTGDARTDDLIVVSGESLVDAVSAVSVAASRDAAIVLTQTDGLPEVVSEFIVDRGFDRVTVGGGTAAVSDTTADALAELTGDANDDTSNGASDGRSSDASGGGSAGTSGGRSSGGSSGGAGGSAGGASVPRVAGATRFETAVAAARAAGQPGDWCDTGYRGAIVVSGESLVDGVIAAPVAYAWRLPLLFTEPDALPQVVGEFLKGVANVRHVTVVGAPTDVSDAVVRDIARSNDIDVLRIDADSPAERSVELTEEVAHCRSQPVAPGQYALLDANQPVDGVAAAAALAHGLGEHGTAETLIPILAVNQNSLPQPVADYLAQVGRRHDQITLYPLGGVARLTPRVIDSAVVAAGGEPTERAVGDGVSGDVPDGGGDGDAADGANPDDRNPGDAGGGPGDAPGASDGSAGAVRPPDAQTGQSGGVAGDAGAASWLDVPRLTSAEANARWPVGSEERQAYLEAAGAWVAPPGADVRLDGRFTRAVASRRGETTSQRYPQGAPSAPTSLNRQDYTFEQRDAARRAYWESLAAKSYHPVHSRQYCESYLDPGNAAYAGYDCVQVGETWVLAVPRLSYDEAWARMLDENWGQGGLGPDSAAGASEVDFEWAVDWYFWSCRVLPEIADRVTSQFDFEVEARVAFYDAWFVGAPPETVFYIAWASEFAEVENSFAGGLALQRACWPGLRIAELTAPLADDDTFTEQVLAEASRRWHAAHPQHRRVKLVD